MQPLELEELQPVELILCCQHTGYLGHPDYVHQDF
jgi:hypothetical protein